MSQPYSLIFTPGRIGHLTAKNRLVLPPMVRNYAEDDGRATARYVAHIERIARGGVGTIILEASFVRQDGKGFSHQLGIHCDDMIDGLRTLVAAGHRYGVLMGIQLYHGGRQASAFVSGSQPLAPSALPDPVVNELPHAMTTAEIADVAAAFGAAARRAQQAGFDFVEIHGAHGYLIAEFLSPFSNRRKDAYGGTPENRRRFLEEVYAAVRAATGENFPITVRLSAEELLASGLTIEETVGTARRLEELGAAALHISNGNYATYALGTMIPPMAIKDGVLLPFAEYVKKAVGIPVIAVGKIRTAAMAEDALRKKQADFIALGRSLLADPDWPAKVASGRMVEVRHCIACNQGCISRLFAQEDVWCTINPEVGREQAFAKLRGGTGRKLLVAGGGPAGMAAARWGALAGFNVVLYEARSVLGGQLLASAAAPHREDWGMLRLHLMSELDRLGVDVRVNSTLDMDGVSREQPWAVIVATGAEPIRPRLTHVEGMRVATGRDVLEQSEPHQGRVIIAGGGCAGAQVAEYLANCGHSVTMIEAAGEVALDAPTDERALLLGRLSRRGVRILPNAKLVDLALTNVIVQLPHETRMLPADMVVLCLGSRSVNELAAALDSANVRAELVGDARQPRKVTEAIAEGALAVLALLQGEPAKVAPEELRPQREPFAHV
jgi:2,4-dienoyl-CoA reductase-like NADH-dependent reductase (Old Yellow Enzyme family)/thioredoxin reductase